jgi:hypothetical protein
LAKALPLTKVLEILRPPPKALWAVTGDRTQAQPNLYAQAAKGRANETQCNLAWAQHKEQGLGL